MIEVHHLQASRSRRITWALEELGEPYTVVTYERDKVTNLAPPALKAIHPLGKSPILRDGDVTLIESGAIIDYLIRTYGHGRFAPAASTPEYNRYVQMLHYAEGSAMLPLMLRLYVGRLGDGGKPLHPRIASEMETHLRWLNDQLEGRDYFLGNGLTGADINLSFVVQMAISFASREGYPNLTAFADRIEARPAYKRAVERYGA